MELFLVLIFLELWSAGFTKRQVVFHSDSKAVVYAINRVSSNSLPVLALLRHLVFKCLEMNVWIGAKYVPGIDNVIAGSLSRLQLSRFRELVPEADEFSLLCP